MQNLLELKGVSRRVSGRFSLRDVTLAVEPGQIVGFVGANGAGKTTTIRAALGLIKLDAGEVHLFGQHCGADAPDETQRCLRSRVGLVLDEATAGLDPMAREELLDELLAFVSDGLHSVLLSSHITSDLDRAADRVICIDNGSIIFDLPREDITDRAGIAHCTQAQAAELMACVEGARAVHHAYSVDVLVPNRRETLEAFPEIPCDRATIDDYLRLMLKGASK